MSPLDAIVLGLIQGITEFIPVSSSGHLIIAHELLGAPTNFEFDVLLNVGTLLALLIFFRTRISKILSDIYFRQNYRLLYKIIIATIPAVTVGFLFNEFFEGVGAKLWPVIFSLVFLGLLMIASGKLTSNHKNSLDKVTAKDSLFIGIAQTLALFPGTSRSGITILAGQIRRLNAQTAAEFSFLLAIPVISGAILHTLLLNDGLGYIGANLGNFLLGNLFSFIFGLLAVKILIEFLKKRGLVLFGYYRLGLAALLIILNFAKII